MTCIENFYQSLTVLSLVILVFYLAVCFPSRSIILKAFLSLFCSFAVFGVLGSFAPSYVPTNPFTVSSTIVVFMLFFWFVAKGLLEAVLLLAVLLVVFPFSIAAQNTVADWINLHTGWNIGQAGVLILMLFVVILIVGLLIYFKETQFIVDGTKCVCYSVLAVVAIRILCIVADSNNPNQFCCSTSSTSTSSSGGSSSSSSNSGEDVNETCPFVFNTVYWILFVFLVLFRFLLLHDWRRIKSKVKCCRCCRRLTQQPQQQQKQEHTDTDSDTTKPDETTQLIKKNDEPIAARIIKRR